MKTNAVIDNILTRRATRSYTSEPVSREDLETIVTCGQWAPSAMNRQQWVFVVIQTADRVQKLAKAIGSVMGRADYDMYEPTAAIVVAHQKDALFGREDDGCAMENMFLAAHSLGLGCVWINQMQDICDVPVIRAELDEMGVPADYIVHGVCALGHIDDPTPIRDRESKVIWV